MRKSLFHTLPFSIVLTLLFCTATAQNGTIKGKVDGRQGRLPLATVNLGNKTLLTDSSGGFSFSLSAGEYHLIVTHTGYKKIEQKVVVEVGNTQVIEFIMVPTENLGDVVVLGSRSAIQRSNLNTAVPVDVFTFNQLAQSGQTSLTQMLNFVAPSVNASRQLINEPVTLRGLNPDQVLILLNNTRYHNLAWIHPGIRGILGRGSVANDLNSIPFAAIEKIEILRDGASAQYGSDAVAGVINIKLKEFTGKTSVNFHLGQYYKGDGENMNFAISRSIALSKRGFLNFALDMRFGNSTYRGGEYTGTAYIHLPLNAPYEDSVRIKAQDDSIIRARNFNRDSVSNAGSSKVASYGILVNGSYRIGGKTELSWTAGLNNRTNVFQAGYGLPKNTNTVNTVLYPDGFRARMRPVQWNINGIFGAKGETKSKVRWQHNTAYGENTAHYYSENTNNASQFALGKNAPTAFYTGTFVYQQLTNNINFSKDFAKENGVAKLFNLGFGAEMRLENYEIRAGEEASWQNYDPTGRIHGGAQNSLVISPDNALNKNRTVVGTYVDVETEPNDHLLINMAGRYEYYSDFGGNLAGKMAARYRFSDKFSLRGSVGNGYRAPSLQQRYLGFNGTTITNVNGALILGRSGVFNNQSEVAKAFGIDPLNAEKSMNLSGGFTAKFLPNIQLTLDAYWIEVRNRVILSGRLDKETFPYLRQIFDKYEVDQVQFFTNAINTKTKGIDIVVNGKWDFKKSRLAIMFSANFNQTRVFGDIKTSKVFSSDSISKVSLFPLEDRIKVERGQPRDKIILSLNYKTGKFGFELRNTRFGETAIVFVDKVSTRYEFFSPRILTDISINYSLKAGLTLTAGVNNILDVYPDRLKNPKNTGQGMYIYAQEASPFGFNGGYYYMSMAFSW